MEIESLIVFLVIGAAAGWLAGTLMKGAGFGIIGNIIVGICGAVLGGFLFGLAGVSVGSGDYSGGSHSGSKKGDHLIMKDIDTNNIAIADF